MVFRMAFRRANWLFCSPNSWSAWRRPSIAREPLTASARLWAVTFSSKLMMPKAPSGLPVTSKIGAAASTMRVELLAVMLVALHLDRHALGDRQRKGVGAHFHFGKQRAARDAQPVEVG